MASRACSGILESTSLASLNTISGFPPASKKRKISHVETNNLLSPIISIKGHASSLSDNEFNLAPIELLPRSALPLTWLDSSTAVQSGNIFASNNELLQDIFSETDLPTVLAARLASNGAIYVVEQVKKHIYALTRLQSSIDEGEVRVAAKRSRNWNSGIRPAKGVADWREAARVQDVNEDGGSFLKHSKYDVRVAFGNGCRTNDNDSGSGSQAPVELMTEENDDPFASEFQAYAQTPSNRCSFQQLQPEIGQNEPGNPTPEVAMENLRTQYLEALYISKTSVAYFAKGPLTRSRNAFQNLNSEGSRCSDLLAFYKESILPVKKMDTKYREGLPTILRNMVLVLSDEERPKKRRSRKKKLGRNGLYPGEDEFIQKCWRSRQMADRGQLAELTKEEEIKRHVSELRLRETQLQILLILEAISLKNTLTEAANDSNAQGDNSVKKREMPKKGEDLNVLLELLLDRLCIWHAVSSAEGVVPESVKEAAENHLSGRKIESDALRDYCNEVIIPFYASRLPEQCKAIKKKLGGAVERASPSHPTPESKGSKTQGGASDRRTQLLKPRRTLQRVLTDEQAAASQKIRHPSLMRSNTTPALQESNGESIEPSLPSLGNSVRGGIQAARRVDKREVDLNAVAKQHESKIRKMGMLMEQKKELDAAINALRKPNRQLVASELADLAEKRTTSARKPRNPVRNPMGQGVQVMATPKASRKKEVHATLLPPPRGLTRRSSGSGKELGTSPALGSDVSLVPQSSVRSTLSSSVVRRDVNSIHETPSRGASKLSDPLDSMGDIAVETPNTAQCSRALFKVPALPTTRSLDDPHDQEISTPVPRRKTKNVAEAAAVDETPPRSSSVKFLAMPSSPLAPLVVTPVKRSVGLDERNTEMVKATPEKSIYEQLGWDEDDLAL